MTPEQLKLWDAAYQDAYGPQYVASYNAEVKKVPALSRVPRGHWRNLWRDPSGHVKTLKAAYPSITDIDDFHYYGFGRWPSREVAEQKARDSANKWDVWIDAEFFPES